MINRACINPGSTFSDKDLSLVIRAATKPARTAPPPNRTPHATWFFCFILSPKVCQTYEMRGLHPQHDLSTYSAPCAKQSATDSKTNAHRQEGSIGCLPVQSTSFSDHRPNNRVWPPYDSYDPRQPPKKQGERAGFLFEHL